MTGPVVAGVDDFDRCDGLLALAAREAAGRETALWLAHVRSAVPVPVPVPVAPGISPGPPPADDPRREATARLDAAAAWVRTEYPGLPVMTLPLSGSPAHALADAADGCAASLLVVGGRGLGGRTGRMLGSVSLRVLTLVRRPVVVVRGDPAPGTGRVMLGVDAAGPAAGRKAAVFAFEEAERRGSDVYAFHAWEDPAAAYMSFDEEVIRRRREADLARGRSRLEEALRPAAAAHPGVPYTCEVLAGSPAGLLVESTALVDLLVVGGRVRGEADAGMRIGALTHTVLHHARCPVAVVPER